MGLIVSSALYPIYGINVLIIFFTNILLDVDHYILYIFKFKSFDIVKAHNYFFNEEKSFLLFFHTVEFLLVLLILSLSFKLVFFVLIGVVIHLLLDIYEETRKKYIGRFPSIVWWYLRKR
ncbi:hypothetical protein COY26_02580 [Candidatus Woesearchaeota archaeon CG_4_10_14_0_2_um_filter_33_10]|nr:MAG: hypothetical protein AUJ83_02555 [Candidatus Woesearchaeota archaeon CG1_02_33_12]PIN79114.1 MAG: hypothetical protein COV14_00935 [Candidatus Woesearchaeota archaeon CG10_big_fil_rev_8_21_14_0_10_33_12]PIZ53224.1 MAG: hypothetical protein COY26_02580 [Candidatus Woesearchaeota archaeon CG_4_10_14_0_2_um_filter_33_10]